MTGMRILITGGAGCLGSSLVEHFIPKGHTICVLDNFATGKKESLPTHPALKLIEGSMTQEAFINEAFALFQPTHVIHSAAAYKDPHNWIEDSATNVLGSIHVAKAAISHSVKRLINFQTALCYGRPSQIPIPIDHPTRPFTSYGISKTAGEAYLMQSGLPVVSLRLSNICGPRLSIGPIPTFYKRLKAGQSCFCSDTVRDFIDMSDFLSLMDMVIEEGAPTGIFNVSTGKGSSVLDVFNTVAEYLGFNPPPDVPVKPPGDDDVPAVVLDPSHTEKSFQWQAKVDFKETIRRQLAWYDQYGIDHIYSHLSAPKN